VRHAASIEAAPKRIACAQSNRRDRLTGVVSASTNGGGGTGSRRERAFKF
jgi:hypothetical protein